jgi:hypothetical protein
MNIEIQNRWSADASADQAWVLDITQPDTGSLPPSRDRDGTSTTSLKALIVRVDRVAPSTPPFWVKTA